MKKPPRPKPKSKRGPQKPVAAPRAQPLPAARAQPSARHVPPQSQLALLYEGIMGTPPAREPRRAMTRAKSGLSVAAMAMTADDRQTLALLSLPVLAMILGLWITHAVKPAHRFPELAAVLAKPNVMPTTRARVRVIEPTAAKLNALPVPPPGELRASLPEALPAALVTARLAALPPAATRAATASLSLVPPAPAQIALLHEARPRTVSPTQSIPVVPGLITREETVPGGPQLCVARAGLLDKAKLVLPAASSLTGDAFGAALAAAARAQTRDLVIYSDKYRAISYPMGDVQPLYGVCTDVIIRAYRALGIDLQQRVHDAHIGGGDTSIDHRRTETLRRFFARFGQSLPASSFAEDYRPGDVVTYNRPQNRHSRSHIALVSDVIAPSGRYMILHNRGWGPQLEDGLFVDEMTGHYRYRGAAAPAEPALAQAPQLPSARPMPLTRLAMRKDATTRRQDGSLVTGLGR